MAREFKYEVKEGIAVISEDDRMNTLEVNRISFNGAEPKYDIRRWRAGDDGGRIMGKGVTMTREELSRLSEVLDEYIENGYSARALLIGGDDF